MFCDDLNRGAKVEELMRYTECNKVGLLCTLKPIYSSELRIAYNCDEHSLTSGRSNFLRPTEYLMLRMVKGLSAFDD